MKKRVVCLWAASIFFSLQIVASGDLFDLVTDWSESNNPNGAWSYRSGTSNLPHQSSSGLDTWGTPQPGWAPAAGASLPFEFKSNGTEQFTHDWIAGDVITHANNGIPYANFLFTNLAAVSVFADVSGTIWLGRDIGRSIDFTLFANSTTLASGTVSSGDPFSRSSPLGFGATGVLMLPGDTLTLELRQGSTSPNGDYVGTTLTINTSSVPEPVTGGLIAVGLTALLVLRRKHRRPTIRCRSSC
jgi:hypothetical protein